MIEYMFYDQIEIDWTANFLESGLVVLKIFPWKTDKQVVAKKVLLEMKIPRMKKMMN